ncbi:transketolase, thiamine diphosphate binding domain protein [Clostridioides difficile Y184]|nr:transketolase, thiamine diphosphate binding domain protein [Clostridioides difficile Y184]
MRDHKGLNEIARIIRRDIVSMIHRAKSGHPGGSLSVVEILTALYFDEMNVDSSNPKMEDRDRFVLSKGHAAPALYATLAEKGYFDKEELNGLRKIGRMLQGHPDMKGTPGVEISTGSLGQGFSVACGMAMASKLDNAPWNVYTLRMWIFKTR